MLPKMSSYVKTFKVKDRDRNSRLMSFHITGNKLLMKYKTVWTKIESLKDIEFNALLVYDDRYIKTKIKTYGGKVYTNFCGLIVPEDGVKCEFLTSLRLILYLVMETNIIYNVNKTVNLQMLDYLDDILFETDED